jgi:hypothetical protein
VLDAERKRAAEAQELVLRGDYLRKLCIDKEKWEKFTIQEPAVQYSRYRQKSMKDGRYYIRRLAKREKINQFVFFSPKNIMLTSAGFIFKDGRL